MLFGSSLRAPDLMTLSIVTPCHSDDAVFVERPWVTSPPLESEEKWGESVLDNFKYPVLWESAHDVEDAAQCRGHEEEDADYRMGSSYTGPR
jgi:hypothetical protein